MGMEKIIGRIKEEARRQREVERELIGEIAAASSQGFAGHAGDFKRMGSVQGWKPNGKEGGRWQR